MLISQTYGLIKHEFPVFETENSTKLLQTLVIVILDTVAPSPQIDNI